MMFRLLSFLFLFLTPITITALTSISTSPLEKWLSQLILHIDVPSTTLPIPWFGDIDFSIPTFECANITLQHIKTSHNNQDISLDMNIIDVSITCHANWMFSIKTWVISLITDGTFYLANAPDSSLQARIQFITGKDGLIESATLPIFKPTINVPKNGISFVINDVILNGVNKSTNATNDNIAKILHYDLVHDLIVNGLNTGITNLITPLITTNLTNAFHSINTIVRPYLNISKIEPAKNISAPTYPGPTRRLVDLTTSPLLHVLDYLLNVIIGSDGPLGINKLMDLFITKQPPGTLILDDSDMKQIITLLPMDKIRPMLGIMDIHTDIHGIAITYPITTEKLGTINITGGIKSLRIDGLDTWDHMRIAVPFNAQTMLIQTGLDTLNVTLSFWISVTIPDSGIHVLTDNGGDTLIEEGTFKMDLSNNLLRTYVQTSMDADQMENVHLDSIVDGGGIPCLASGLLAAAVPAILFDTDVNELSLSTGSTTAIGVGSLEDELDALITNLATLFTGSFRNAIPALFNGLVDGPARMGLENLLQVLVNQSMNSRQYEIQQQTSISTFHDTDVPQACPYPREEPFGVNNTDTAIAFGAFTGAWLLIVIALAWYARASTPLERMRITSTTTSTEPHKNLVIEHVHVTPTNIYDYHTSSPTATNYHTSSPTATTTIVSPLSASLLAAHERTESIVKPHIKGSGPALAFAPDVSMWWRYGVPFLICMNIALFVSSNTGIGAGVSLRLKWPNATEWIYNLFEFLLTGTIHDMWVAGVYPLSLLILIFSGAWPYIKLILLMFCWVLRPTGSYVLSIKWRHRCLAMLDSLGKYSLIDAYVMTLMMVAFRFSINMPDTNNTADTYAKSSSNGTNGNDTISYIPAAADVFVLPEWGIYSFILATIMSLFLTHMVSHVHRHAQNRGTALDPNTTSIRAQEANREKISLMTIGDPKHKHWATSTRWGRWGIALMLILSLCNLFSGAVITSFTFKFEGLVAIALQGNTEQSYSLFSIVPALFPASPHPNFGIVFIQVVYLLFSFVVPSLHILLLFIVWCAPLTLRTQYALFVWCETLNAWSAIEVFVLSVIASILEIRQFAAFMVGNNCDIIPSIIYERMPQELLNGSAKCFDVVATLDRGCWVLFCGCLVYIFSRNVVMKLCHTNIRRRAKIKLDGDAWATPRTARSDSSIGSSYQSPQVRGITSPTLATLPEEGAYVENNPAGVYVENPAAVDTQAQTIPPSSRRSRTRSSASSHGSQERGTPSPSRGSPTIQHDTLIPIDNTSSTQW